MRFAGLDIGGRTHAVAIVDEHGAVLVRPTSFAEDAKGYARLLAMLGPAADILRQAARFIVERRN